MKNKILIVGDIHFGINATERLYAELQQVLISLKTEGITHLVINGDYFDSDLMLSSKAGLLAIQFWSDIVDICREYNIKIRVIEGTRTHDRFQFDALSEFVSENEVNKYLDFKYFKTATVEDLDGMHILYVPEEYPENGADYYNEFRNDKYDVMFVHGMWDFTGLEAVAKNVSKAPFFNYGDWKESLEHGIAISSHYHGRKVNDDGRVVYIGSFTSWRYDYETDRGYCILEVDTDTHLHECTLVTNEMAPKYITVVGKDVGIPETATADEIKTMIESFKEDCDYLRLDLTGYDEYLVLVLKQAYSGDKTVTIIDKTLKAKMINESITDRKSNVNQAYAFVLDQSLNPLDVISKFIEEKNKTHIDNKLIEYVITPDIEVSKMISEVVEDASV